MAKIILTEEQFKNYVKMLCEEEYAVNIPIRTFSSEDEAKQFLSYIRQKYGFSQHDSYINGTTVFASVEKDPTDDSYFYDMVNSMKGEAEGGGWKVVAEGMDEYYSNPYGGKPTFAGKDTYYRMKWDYRYTFGKCKGRTLKDVFDSGSRGKDYMAWMYYNVDNIDYADDVKQALNLTTIEKPGNNEEIYKQWHDENIEANMTDDEKAARDIRKMADMSHRRKVARDKAAYIMQKSDSRGTERDDKISKAGRLAWYNQGHR